ncbi:uncharacterized protein LOC143222744 isoform X3 [Tachypleus tridentatus]|uniref:uncharacterized protein LOC143222744 isoform X3 n=1 Tax=Tachypleus tridentatus TaxID=6853 RepID=UPI003FD05714
MLSSENLLRKYKNLPLSFPHVYKTSRDLVRIEEKLLRILSQEKDVLSPDCTGYCVTSKQNGEVVWEMQDLHVKVKKVTCGKNRRLRKSHPRSDFRSLQDLPKVPSKLSSAGNISADQMMRKDGKIHTGRENHIV